MADIRTTTAASDSTVLAEAPPAPTHVAIRREDYRPPDWLVPELSLDFDLRAERTRVRATLEVVRNGAHDEPLRLDGDELELVSIAVDGQPAQHRMAGQQLVIDIVGDRATIETEVNISPAANTKLMGLYASGG